MKKGWQKKTLADVCKIKPPKSEARERLAADTLVSFAPMEDLGIDRKFLNATQVKLLASVAGSYTYFADGDVLLAKITPCFENGKLGVAAGLSNGIGFGSSEFLVFRPSASLDKEYLYYYLSRADFRTEGAARMGGAVGQQRVSKEFVESYPIPLPPLPEQRRIVGILDEAFAGLATAKANAEKNLQNARALFESHLQSVFTQRGPGWVEKTLSPATDGIFTGPFGSLLHKSDYIADGIPLVNPAHITEVGIEPDLRKTVSKATALRLKNYIMREGDIVIGRRGEMGRCALVTEVEDGWLCGTGSFFIKPSPEHCEMKPRLPSSIPRSAAGSSLTSRSAWKCRAGSGVGQPSRLAKLLRLISRRAEHNRAPIPTGLPNTHILLHAGGRP
jgi:type I restriction enzyme S subunit